MPLSAAAAAELTRQFKVCVEDLQKVKEAAREADAKALGSVGFGGREVMRVLDKLAKLPVTGEILKDTGVGNEVNDRFVRLHDDTLVRERSKELVHIWKARVQADKVAAKKAEVEAEEERVAAEEEAAAEAARAAAAEAAEAARVAEEKAADAARRERAEAAEAARVAEAEAADVARRECAEDAGSSARPDDTASPAASAEEAGGSPAEGAASSPGSPTKRKAEDGGESAEKKSKADGGTNEELAALFKELSAFEFKNKQKWEGRAYQKVADVLSQQPEKITSGSEAKKLQDIGKESAKKIDQFLETGKIDRLEKYRRGEFD